MSKSRWTMLPMAALLVACASQEAQVTQSVNTPLQDLNLVNAPIPEVLVAAGRAPYAVPASIDCTALATAVRELDEVLGADVDTPPSDARPGLVERGADVAGQAAADALQRTAESVVPFRAWVRKLTGAERYSRRVAAAIAAGTARRAFLKGMAAAQGCAIGRRAP